MAGVLGILSFLLLGLGTGCLSGLMGVGGGIVLIPALVYLFGFSQHMAQGTTLALFVPPIGILAAWTYYKNGYLDIRAGTLIALGFVIGSYFGANYAVTLPDAVLRRIFAAVLFFISIKMWLGK